MDIPSHLRPSYPPSPWALCRDDHGEAGVRVHIRGKKTALQMLFGFLTAAVFIGIRDRRFTVNIRRRPRDGSAGRCEHRAALRCTSRRSAVCRRPSPVRVLEPLTAVVFAAALLHETIAAVQIPVRCSSSAVPLAPECAHAAATAPEVLSRFAYRQLRSGGCAVFSCVRPVSGEHRRTGGTKNRRHTSVCRRFTAFGPGSREPLIDARRTMVYSERAVRTRTVEGGHP